MGSTVLHNKHTRACSLKQPCLCSPLSFFKAVSEIFYLMLSRGKKGNRHTTATLPNVFIQVVIARLAKTLTLVLITLESTGLLAAAESGSLAVPAEWPLCNVYVLMEQHIKSHFDIVFVYCAFLYTTVQEAGIVAEVPMSCMFVIAVAQGHDFFIWLFYWFSTQCVLCGGFSNLFLCASSDLFSWPSCSQYSNPAVQSLIQPFVQIFCGAYSTKYVHQNISWKSGCFFNSRESVSISIAFNYL